MPHYEFFCHACEQNFSKTLTPAEYEEGKVLCPHCGSEKSKRDYQPFTPSRQERA